MPKLGTEEVRRYDRCGAALAITIRSRFKRHFLIITKPEVASFGG